MLYFPLAVLATLLGSVFVLQIVCLAILVASATAGPASPYEGDDPVIAAFHQVRITNHPPSGPWHGIRAEPAPPDAVKRVALLVLGELAKYGDSALPRIPLRRVVLCAELKANGTRAGGLTLGGMGVILLDVGRDGPGADAILKHSFHHEMSHVLDDAFRRDAGRDARWSRLNPGDFAYGGNEVVRALEVLGEDPRGRPDVPGFLTYYAMANPGEDRAEIFAAMMTSPEVLSLIVEDDPILWAKCRLLRSELVARNPGFAAILTPPASH